MGGGVKLPRGTDTPGVEELPRGYKISGVTIKGDGVPGTDNGGREGKETPQPPVTPMGAMIPDAEKRWRADRSRRRRQLHHGARQKEREAGNTR